MRAAQHVAAVLLALSFSSCALVETPAEESSPRSEAAESAAPDASASSTSAAPEARTADPAAFPLRFDADAKTVLPEKPVYDGVVVGERVVTMTLQQLHARTLPDLESAWQIAPTGLFVDLATSDEQLYALDLRVLDGVGTKVGKHSSTLSRISPATGAVLDEVTWEKSQDVQSSGDPVFKIAEIADDLVLVESSGSVEGARHTVTAVDLGSGEELWTKRPASFLAEDDGRVLLSTGSAQEPGAVVAVDAKSGDPTWMALDGLVDADAVGVHEGALTLVQQTGEDEDPSVVTLALDDGTVRSQEQTDVAEWSCDPTGDTVVVCSLPGEKAVGFDLALGRTTWRLPTSGRYGLWVSSVRGPYVYGFTSGGRSVVLDAMTGRDVSEAAGAAPVSSNGYGGLIFYSGQAIFYPAADADGVDSQ